MVRLARTTLEGSALLIWVVPPPVNVRFRVVVPLMTIPPVMFSVAPVSVPIVASFVRLRMPDAVTFPLNTSNAPPVLIPVLLKLTPVENTSAGLGDVVPTTCTAAPMALAMVTTPEPNAPALVTWRMP